MLHDCPLTVGAAAGCDLLMLFLRSKDRSLRQLLQGERIPNVGVSLLAMRPSTSMKCQALAKAGRSPVNPRASRTKSAFASGICSTSFNPALRNQRTGKRSA